MKDSTETCINEVTIFYCKLRSKDFDFNGLEKMVKDSTKDSNVVCGLQISTKINKDNDIYHAKISIVLSSDINLDFSELRHLLDAISNIFELVSEMKNVQTAKIYMNYILKNTAKII